MSYQISETDKEIDPMDILLRRQIDQADVQDKGYDRVNRMRAGNGKYDDKPDDWRDPFP